MHELSKTRGNTFPEQIALYPFRNIAQSKHEKTPQFGQVQRQIA